ncbi:macro domain-containing protein TTE0995-like [Zophobas morio]|uniref:macro domain-containing protein TTE0995-like n=1 Tax=Zophobas morio TaxID=2755281 RepID=UPI0030830039
MAKLASDFLVLDYQSLRPWDTVLYIVQGSIVKFRGTAIVNAADSYCLGGGGVDGAISRAGGEILRRAREALPVDPEGYRCPVGNAKVTVAGALPCKYVIHAVGPCFPSNPPYDEYDRLLSSAYIQSLLRAKENAVESIAFSLISAGVFRGTRELKSVITIALKTIADNIYEGLKEIYVVAYSDTDAKVLVSVFSHLFKSP